MHVVKPKPKTVHAPDDQHIPLASRSPLASPALRLPRQASLAVAPSLASVAASTHVRTRLSTQCVHMHMHMHMHTPTHTHLR